MKIKSICLFVGLLCLSGFKPQSNFSQFAGKFVAGYKALKIPQLDLSYVTMLKQIKSAEEIKKQTDFFEAIKSEQKKIAIAGLTASQKQDYELIVYETDLNMERLALEKQ